MISLLPGLRRPADKVLAAAETDLAKGRAKKAFAAVKALAERGDAAGQMRLARMYQNGEGALQDFSAALKWYKAAAEQGHAEAQNELGLIHFAGRVATRSATTAALAQIQREDDQGASLLRSMFPEGFSIKQDFAEAARWSERAASAGHAGAQARLGYQYAAGLGVARDPAAAERWLTEAARHDDEMGLLCLGVLYAGGHGDAPRYDEAAALFARLAERTNAAAEFNLGLLALRGLGVPQDRARAEALFTSSAERGHLPAMHQLGLLLAGRDGDPEARRAAETWLRRAGVRGHLPALVALGQLLADGASGSPTEAASLFREAADLGSPEGRHRLALCYRDGKGLPRDLNEAARWFSAAIEGGFFHSIVELMALRAAGVERAHDLTPSIGRLARAVDTGDLIACHYLGLALTRGEGVEADPIRAVELLTRSANAGNLVSAGQLGALYAAGSGPVKQDFAQAATWYRRAGEGGDPTSVYNLAFLYIRGFGVEQDVGRGEAMLAAIAEAGFLPAAEALHVQHSPGGMLEPEAAKAAHWLERAATLGSADAVRRLARRRFEEAGAVPAEARALLEKAAAAGDANAQVELGRFLQFGADGEPPDMLAAQGWMERAAAAGSAEALAWLGDVHRQKLSPEARPEVAEQYYRLAVERGHVGAMVMLALLLSQPDAGEAARTEAAELWRSAAAAGNDLAKRRYGECLLRGIGVPRDVEGGLSVLTPLAEAGDVAAQLALGVFHAARNAPQADPTQASIWFRRAADAGDVNGQYNLGVCYRIGLGIPADAEAARRWYELAAAKSFPSAQLALADLLRTSPKTPADEAQAAELYRKVTEIYPHAWHGLGALYETGRGVPRDEKLAVECYQRAAERGFQPAIEALKKLEPAPAHA